MRKILITGGAGFIGVNATEYFLKKGYAVTVLDNLSRKGSGLNIEWLIKNYPKIKFIEGDVRDQKLMTKAVANSDVVLHLAAQVAVTTSVSNPREDFEINALGSLNVLEAARKAKRNPILIYSSTNKVYGALRDQKIVEEKTRYRLKNLPFGISENDNLDFHSPYGCSKGAADQYFRDYHRIYGLRTVVFRQSCIYGPRQFGIEDQGWLAWFLIAGLLDKSITIFGNGKQVRDLLYVGDLVNAFESAVNYINTSAGQIYNIGGGKINSLSIWWEFKPILEGLLKKKINVSFAQWRPGDQLVYISDNRKTEKDLKWRPKVGYRDGIKRLYYWILENRSLLVSLDLFER